MENVENCDKITYDLNDESEVLESSFKFDYIEQNFDNNIKFQNWKNSMIQEYGKDAKLFKCLKDKIYFYSSYKDCISYPCYRTKCPKCKEYICHFCSYSGESENIRCCFKKAIGEQLFYYGFKYIKLIDKEDVEIKKISNNYKLLFTLIPGLNFFLIYAAIMSNCLFQLKLKNAKGGEEVREIYDDIFFGNILFIIGLFAPKLLFIPLIIYNIYFVALLILISIPFKFYPLKYLLGFIDGDYYDFY